MQKRLKILTVHTPFTNTDKHEYKLSIAGTVPSFHLHQAAFKCFMSGSIQEMGLRRKKKNNKKNLAMNPSSNKGSGLYFGIAQS